jgi:hypothetical protein
MKLTHKKNTTNMSVFTLFGHFTFPLKRNNNTRKVEKTLKLPQTTAFFIKYPTKENKALQIEAEKKRNQAQIYASTTPIR